MAHYVTVDVKVSLDHFDDDDLIDHLRGRGYAINDSYIDNDIKSQIQGIHDAYTLGRKDDVDRLLKDLFHEGLGRIT